MKTPSLLLAAALLANSAIAADAPAKATPPAPAKAAAVGDTLPATAAKITAPFVLKDGAISQPATTDVAGGGRAEFTFTVATAGTYAVHGIVSAPDEDSNSFFLNIDGTPEEPLMIWDLEVTDGFEERVSNWRGNGESGSGEFNPKTFKLTAGEHKLIIVGREPAALKSISVRPAK